MFEKWLDNPSALTVSGILLASVWAFLTERVVPGVVHRREMAQKQLKIDKLEVELDNKDQMIYRLMGYVDKGLDLADTATRRG